MDFKVRIKNTFSEPRNLCGVPHRSILGRLLFLLIINGMPQAVDYKLLLYADDTCLTLSCIMLQKGQTYFKNLAVRTQQDF